ncbi:MAG: hypothetical protein KA297_01200 [Kofleriaceae bacterium]|jgi:hypothetical protein|nr:hypothetical protein [Kofleriaceae bacterium]MBP6836681.1 hypothetical protein [Kofleriaceae bacterium]
MTSARRGFRFRPRYRGIRLLTVAVAASLIAGGLAWALPAMIVAGGVGLALTLAYQLSPTWRLAVEVDDEALRVHGRSGPRLALPWGEVRRVVHAPSSNTMFIDGGDPARSLLVPGVGAPAPYAIEDAAALCEAVLARVPPERVETVASLDAPKPTPGS